MTATIEVKYCILCLRKSPPVYTKLVIGENITQGRWDRSNFCCNDCTQQRSAEYRDGLRIRFAEYIQQLHDDTIDILTEQWNDPAFRKSDVISRIVKVWDKYKRRSPETGIRRNWILEVIFHDLWFMDANGIIEEFYRENKKRPSYQANSKQYLLEFVVANLEMLREPFRRRAINKWEAVVQAVNREFYGREILCATPEYVDPILNESVNNWYLMSEAEHQQRRANIRDATAIRGLEKSEYEEGVVRVREEITIKEEQKRQQERQNDTLKEGNGDNNQ